MARGEMESAACTNCGLVRFESNGERLLRSATPGWTTPCRWCESWRANDDELWPAPSEPPASAPPQYRNLVAMLRGDQHGVERVDLRHGRLLVRLTLVDNVRRVCQAVPPEAQKCTCMSAADIGAPDVYGGEQVIAHANPYCPAHGAIANSSAAAATRASLAASQCSKTVPGIDSVEPWPCSLLAGHEGDCE